MKKAKKTTRRAKGTKKKAPQAAKAARGKKATTAKPATAAIAPVVSLEVPKGRTSPYRQFVRAPFAMMDSWFDAVSPKPLRSTR